MLPPESDVLLGRQDFLDAQVAMAGQRSFLGYYTAGWHGSNINDERGSFAIVNEAGQLFENVGDYLSLLFQGREVFVYVIGSQANLLTDVALTRRAYMALQLLAVEPITAKVSVVT